MSHKKSRPNILFIMVDEMRFPVAYETAQIKEWRHKYLKAQKRLKREGIEFVNHYTAATACAPARGSLFTGCMPSIHGVYNTDGAAKSAFSPTMSWLDPNTVPTMGDYFKEADYKTLYKGKWHISEADIIIPGTKNAVPSYNQNGTVDLINTEIYKNADRLEKFGFHSFIGPEPHGSSALNSGSSSAQIVNGRDIVYVDEVINLFNNLNNCEDEEEKNKPWLLVASLVNPHDITLWGELTAKAQGFDFMIDESVPIIPPAPTANEDLFSKPDCQASYKERYQVGFQPTFDNETYRRLYYSLNLTADRNVDKILDALDKNNLTDNTIVVFTSDHGDYIGAHGLFQKWYTAYEEAIHVPLIIRMPPKMNHKMRGKKVTTLTSHIDILPTLLGLANANVDIIQNNMKKTFTEVTPFVGRDLSPILYGHKIKNEPILFITNDNPLKGDNQFTIIGKPYEQVRQPANIQTIIVHLSTNYSCHENEAQLYKFSRYYDDPQFWTNPNVYDVTTVQADSLSIPNESNVVVNAIISITKTEPEKDQYEMYNLTDDPFEINNLAHPINSTEETKELQIYLHDLLEKLIKDKCLIPKSKTSWMIRAE